MIIKALNKYGDLVNIDEVKNGIECNCFCPNCKKPLIAKNNGEERIHHFSHMSNDADCGYNNDLHDSLPVTLKELFEKYYLPFFCFNGYKYFYFSQIPRNNFTALEAAKNKNEYIKKLGGIIIKDEDAKKPIWQICGKIKLKEEYKIIEKSKEYKQKLINIFDTLVLDTKEKFLTNLKHYIATLDKKTQANLTPQEQKLLENFSKLDNNEQNKILNDIEYFNSKHLTKERRA